VAAQLAEAEARSSTIQEELKAKATEAEAATAAAAEVAALREKLTAAEASVAQAEANVEKYRNAARHWKMQHDKLKAEASA
jgi:hypothetical protein